MGLVTRIRRWSDRLRKPGGWLCLAALALGVAFAEELLEYRVKAAFLLNFTKFTEWPAEAFATSDSPIAICILGADPFGSALDQIVAGEVVGGRRIVVQRIKRTPPPKSCQALFVSRSEPRVAVTLHAVGPGVLTIGEGQGFIREGGMIAFQVEDRKVRFSISQSEAERAGLKLSSKLLSVAKPVEN
jgi:hypothetical protein